MVFSTPCHLVHVNYSIDPNYFAYKLAYMHITPSTAGRFAIGGFYSWNCHRRSPSIPSME